MPMGLKLGILALQLVMRVLDKRAYPQLPSVRSSSRKMKMLNQQIRDLCSTKNLFTDNDIQNI